jgi:hypothetical protein
MPRRTGEGGVQLDLQRVQERQPIAGSGVAELVGQAREPVDGVERAA